MKILSAEFIRILRIAAGILAANFFKRCSMKFFRNSYKNFQQILHCFKSSTQGFSKRSSFNDFCRTFYKGFILWKCSYGFIKISPKISSRIPAEIFQLFLQEFFRSSSRTFTEITVNLLNSFLKKFLRNPFSKKFLKLFWGISKQKILAQFLKLFSKQFLDECPG